MTYGTALTILQLQDRNIRKIDGVRMVKGNYEYRIKYFGGFASYVGIDRREIGKRNFKYFSCVGAAHCWSVQDVLKLVDEEIENKTKKGDKLWRIRMSQPLTKSSAV